MAQSVIKVPPKYIHLPLSLKSEQIVIDIKTRTVSIKTVTTILGSMAMAFSTRGPILIPAIIANTRRYPMRILIYVLLSSGVVSKTMKKIKAPVLERNAACIIFVNRWTESPIAAPTEDMDRQAYTFFKCFRTGTSSELQKLFRKVWSGDSKMYLHGSSVF